MNKPKRWGSWGKERQWGYLRGLAAGRVEKVEIADHWRKEFKGLPTRWFKGLEKWELKAYYTGLLPELREVARRAGYCLGVHGSMQCDLDLVAVVWEEKAVSYEVLAKRLHKAACGAILKHYHWTYKPHGRKATAMHIGSVAYIDLSVMSKQKKAA